MRLTSTSYVVLGLLDWLGPSTPYALKRALTESVEDFFPVPHTSFYAEPARLAGAGYVSEDREESGRRRKTYALTPKGRDALERWLRDPRTGWGEFRFPGILKTFFGADPAGFAREQSAHHRELADRFTGVRARVDARGVELPSGRRAVLETGIRLHTWWAQTWLDIAEAAAARPPQGRAGDAQGGADP